MKIDQRPLVADLLDDGMIDDRSTRFGHDIRDTPERRIAARSAVAKPQLHFDPAHLPRIVLELFAPMRNRLVRKPVGRTPRPDLAQAREHVPPRGASPRQLLSVLPPAPQGKQLAQRFHVRHGKVEPSSERPVRPGLALSALACIGLEEVFVRLELGLLVPEKLQSLHPRCQRLEVDHRARNLQDKRTFRRDAGGVVEQRETVPTLFQNVRQPLGNRTQALALPPAPQAGRSRHKGRRTGRIPPLEGRQGQERIFGHGRLSRYRVDALSLSTA